MTWLPQSLARGHVARGVCVREEGQRVVTSSESATQRPQSSSCGGQCLEDTRASSAAGRESTLPSPVTCPVTCLSVGSVHFSLGCVPLFSSTRLAGQETTGWATVTTSATVEQVRNLLSLSSFSLSFTGSCLCCLSTNCCCLSRMLSLGNGVYLCHLSLLHMASPVFIYLVFILASRCFSVFLRHV